MAPNVGLTYSGGGVNGPVGHGWTVQGISTITRCANTRVIDGSVRAVAYTSDDKLCLDGQRLIQTDANGNVSPFPQSADTLGGTGLVREYRTEKDTYARVRAYGAAGGNAANGPSYFKVWTKSGQVYEYGNNGNSTANANITIPVTDAKAGVVTAWAVSRISDSLGNYIDFQYEQRDIAWGSGPVAGTPTAGHEWNLTEIRYTGTSTTAPFNKVVFSYIDRPVVVSGRQDRAETYHLGSKNVSVRLLTKVQTFINTGATAIKVKTVKLGYDNGTVTNRSRVTSITECAGQAETACLPAATFVYKNGGSDVYVANTSFNLKTETLVAGGQGVLAGDFNGDGKTDLLRWSDSPAQNKLWLSNGDGGFTAAANFNITDQNLYKSDGCYTTVVTDLNADGLPDLLRYSAPKNLDGVACGAYGPVLIYLNNGDGTFTQRAYGGPTLERAISSVIKNCHTPIVNGFCAEPGAHAGWSRGANFYMLDVDGDGRPDLVTTILPLYDIEDAEVDACASQVCTHVYKGNGDGTFTEMVTNIANRSIYAIPSKGTGFGSPKNLVDIDGDGLTDFAGLETRYFNKSSAFRSRGDGNFDPIGTGSICNYPMDFNGDGRSDCLIPGLTANLNLMSLANGAGAMVNVANFNLTAAGNELSGTGVGLNIVDLNNDGRHDILRWNDDPAKTVAYLSNGDGTFTASTTFNLNVAASQLKKSDGTFDFITGDFTGRGNTEFLRMRYNPSGTAEATTNQLYVRQDPSQPDLLDKAVSPTGLVTQLTWVPLSNSSSGNLGSRYSSDRGGANKATYPKVDVNAPMYVVATSETDVGVGNAKTKTEYSYAGLKGSYDGRGAQGFRETRRQSTGPNGAPLTVVTQYVQDHPYTGVAVKTETWNAALNATNPQVLSRSTFVYCDKTAAPGAEAVATATAPCPTSAKLQRPYLYKTTEEGADLTGTVLPNVVTTNTFNNTGDPTQIWVRTQGTALGMSQTFDKTTTNLYYTDVTSGDNWVLGRLQKSTQANSVPDALSSITSVAGTAPNATATQGTGTPPPPIKLPPPPMSVGALMSILQMLLED